MNQSTAVAAPPRIAYPAMLSQSEIDEGKWRVLVMSTFPNAESAEAVSLGKNCRSIGS